VVSGKGPGANEADDLFSDQVINGFVGGMNHALEASGVDGRATIKVVRVLKLDSYAGKHYAVSGPGFSAVVRVLSKRVDDRCQLFMLFVMTRSGDGSLGNQFLNSFKINGQ